MHFIEDLFGLSPDANSGSLELLLFLVPLVAGLAAWTLWRRRHDAAASSQQRRQCNVDDASPPHPKHPLA
jgi:hypothetical protein